MSDQDVLAKTDRINRLFDYYCDLLTEKQRNYFQLYFHENYSLGEIAEEFSVSRQAVYEHIKRAELSLEDYENKLKLLASDELRRVAARELAILIRPLPMEQQGRALNLLRQLGGDEIGI